MCWWSLINFARISNKLIHTIMVLIVSLSNLESGFSSYVSTENIKVLKENFNSLKYRTLVRNPANDAMKSSVSSKLHRSSVTERLGLSQSDYHTQEDQSTITTIYTANDKHKRIQYYHSHFALLHDLQRHQPLTAQPLAELVETHRQFDMALSYVENNYGGNSSNESMYFGTDNSTVITTQIGATALIPCTVHQIGEGVVSWIRKKDYHLLTVGLTTYSSDERFSASHLKHSEQDWTLQIKFVQQRDAGIYECQISTHPPTAIYLNLVVVEARAEISGPSIRYLTPGSMLRLQCLIVQNTETSEYIFWYHDNRMINYDADRGITVSTASDFQSSELIISTTRRGHSGNYTCVASNTQPASVLVHIFKGDNPAAMYHGHVGSSTKSYQTELLHIIVSVCYRAYAKWKLSL